MPVTMEDVVRLLIPDEANLDQAAASLGAEALPHLELLIRGPDPMLASKAVYVTSQLRDPRVTEILLLGATREERMVRIAAALTLRSLPPDQANELLIPLLLDADAECRRMAIEAVPSEATPDVHRVVEMLALTDPYPLLREMSAAVLAKPDEKRKGSSHE
jgi:HEAT repeat protein